MKYVRFVFFFAGLAWAAFLLPSAAASSNPRSQGVGGNKCNSKTTAFLDPSSGGYVTETVTLDATVAENQYCQGVYHDICTGQVYFYIYSDGAWSELGMATPAGECYWQLPVSSFSAGKHRIKATYTNDGDGYTGSTGFTSVDLQKWGTTVTLTSTPNPSLYNEDVTFTATAVPSPDDPTTPTGKIRFLNGVKAIGTATVDSNGVATLVTKRLPAGMDSITAEYLGDADNAPGVSAALTQVVNPAAH